MFRVWDLNKTPFQSQGKNSPQCLCQADGKSVILCVLYVATGGDLRVLTAGGDDVVFAGFPDGGFLPVNVVRVFATNTTASGILALW